MIFSTIADAVLFALAIFCFVMCFFSRVYLYTQFEDCLKDYVNEGSFLREVKFIILFEHGCALVGTALCLLCGHYLSGLFGVILCLVHLDEWRRGRATLGVMTLRSKNLAKETRLYIYVKIAAYCVLMLWLCLSLYSSLWQFLDENPSHVLNLFRYWVPFAHHVEIIKNIAGYRHP